MIEIKHGTPKSETERIFMDILCNKANVYETIEPMITVEDFTNRLREMGYFTVPASLKFHGTFGGGLFAHSLRVAEILAEYTKKLGLVWVRPCSPWIVGLFHDLCKCDEYIDELSYEVAELKEPITPRDCEFKIPPVTNFVTQRIKFKRNDQQLLTGHGEKSVMLLSRFMTLTEEEILCIRYHMGAYNPGDWNSFDLAIKKYPNVLYTHTADMLASKVYNI